MATRPTRPTKDSPAVGESTQPAETKAQAAKTKPARKTPAKRTPASKLAVFYEDAEGNLQNIGAFKGAKPEEALTEYLNALEEAEKVQALEAATYAVETPKGLVRITVGEKREYVFTKR